MADVISLKKSEAEIACLATVLFRVHLCATLIERTSGRNARIASRRGPCNTGSRGEHNRQDSSKGCAGSHQENRPKPDESRGSATSRTLRPTRAPDQACRDSENRESGNENKNQTFGKRLGRAPDEGWQTVGEPLPARRGPRCRAWSQWRIRHPVESRPLECCGRGSHIREAGSAGQGWAGVQHIASQAPVAAQNLKAVGTWSRVAMGLSLRQYRRKTLGPT